MQLSWKSERRKRRQQIRQILLISWVRLGSASQPCDGVSADGEEDDGHVEFEGLGGAFGSGDAVAHDVEDCAVLVLDEFPGEKAGADSEP